MINISASGGVFFVKMKEFVAGWGTPTPPPLPPLLHPPSRKNPDPYKTPLGKDFGWSYLNYFL